MHRIVKEAMSSETFNLTWNSHPLASTNLLVNLLRDQELTDVTLVCGDDQQVRAHKAVLGSASPILKKIFQRSGNERIVIYLSGVSMRDMEAMVNFVYLGEATVNQSNINSFFTICKEFQIEGLTDYSILPTCKDISSSTIPASIKVEENNRSLENRQLNLTEEVVSLVEEKTIYPCEMCDFEATSLDGLESHKLDSHRDNSILHSDGDNVGESKSDICEKNIQLPCYIEGEEKILTLQEKIKIYKKPKKSEREVNNIDPIYTANGELRYPCNKCE